MTAIDALLELLNRVGACQGKAGLVLFQWPKAAVKAMKAQKLIIKARPATSAVCTGCESNCVMPVHSQAATTGKPLPFIVCDKRSDINRVLVSAGSLIQWQCNVDLISKFIITSLGLHQSVMKNDNAGRMEIGMVLGNKRSQMLCLESDGTLNLIAGNSKVPLAEFIEFQNGAYILDDVQVRRLVDSATTADNRYTPSNARQEARKLDTQAKYESWRKAYRALKNEKPDRSDVWYSLQIKKLKNAKEDSETIRKHMKK
ncbi:MAG TPA: hypothetical protein PKW50_03690 [Syntrophomonas sp.]|nr:hypothetical protein [Syntrophomonas sp.]